MNIEQILDELQTEPQCLNPDWAVDGNIENDHENGTLRLYPNSDRRDFFYLVKQRDIEGDVHKWTDEELQSVGRVNEVRYRLHIKAGSIVRSVRIQTEIAGIASLSPTQCQSDDARDNYGPCNCNCRPGQSCATRSDGSCECY